MGRNTERLCYERLEYYTFVLKCVMRDFGHNISLVEAALIASTTDKYDKEFEEYKLDCLTM